MADAKTPIAGAELSLRIGQRVRHGDYKGRRVTGIVRGLSDSDGQGLMASVALDEPIVIPPRGDDQREIHIRWQNIPAHELAAFDDRDELIAELLVALQHAVRWFDQLKPEDIARYRVAIARATGSAA
jgi:hypothetical protein